MNADELRALQAPFKEKYKADPQSALVTLSARGRMGDGITWNVETHDGTVTAGLHPATGGDGSAACSAEMLLEALVGCAGVTLRAVATALRIELKHAEITASGIVDMRGTLGVDREAAVGFQSIRLKFHLDTDADPDKVAKLVQLTERYCVVYQTIARGVPVEAVVADG